MTEGPPSSAASSSKLPPVPEASSPTQSPIPPSSSPSVASNPSATQPLPQAYANYATWGSVWPSAYSGYYPAATNASAHQMPYAGNPYAAHMYQPQPQLHTFSAPQLPKSTDTKNTVSTNQPASSKPPSPPPPPPPLPEPETYKDWDEVLSKFLTTCKLTQTLKGLENDMLVLNPEWEQKTIPDALKELVTGLQSILDRISGKQKAHENSMQVDEDVDITSTEDALGSRPLEERKVDYAHLSLGVERRSPSSINKSISQFLARTRARNDASNRSEFLYTLAEKKRQLAQSRTQSDKGQDTDKDKDTDQNAPWGPEAEIVSCARVDARPIDRDKQIKYDIAKYGEGPLTKTVHKPGQDAASSSSAQAQVQPGPGPADNPAAPGPSHPSTSAPAPTPVSNGSQLTSTSTTQPIAKRKRKLSEMNGPSEPQAAPKASSRRKGKGKATAPANGEGPAIEGSPSTPGVPGPDGDEEALASATASKHPGLDERLRNLEEHLAVRYVPTPPRTLMARLKYLEDHVIKLEKEYPPWAALHFNQPRRGWPPPPRATPLIVPPHLRTVTSSSSAPSTTTADPNAPSSTAIPSSSISGTTLSGQAAGTGTGTGTGIGIGIGIGTGTGTNAKPKKTSTLHRAVLERLEVQRAMSEMSGKGRAD